MNIAKKIGQAAGAACGFVKKAGQAVAGFVQDNAAKLVIGTITVATLGAPHSASAAVDTSITDAMTDVSTFFDSQKTFVIGVVVFSIVIGYLAMARRRR